LINLYDLLVLLLEINFSGFGLARDGFE
jgi:hypothetical protein